MVPTMHQMCNHNETSSAGAAKLKRLIWQLTTVVPLQFECCLSFWEQVSPSVQLDIISVPVIGKWCHTQSGRGDIIVGCKQKAPAVALSSYDLFHATAIFLACLDWAQPSTAFIRYECYSIKPTSRQALRYVEAELNVIWGQKSGQNVNTQ